MLPKPLLLFTVLPAARRPCCPPDCSARLGGTFSASSLVHQVKTFSHQRANGPGGTGAAHAGQGTQATPARETHASLHRWGTRPWLSAAFPREEQPRRASGASDGACHACGVGGLPCPGTLHGGRDKTCAPRRFMPTSGS